MNINNAKYEASFGVIEQILPCEGPEFAFAGRSNVGKSSLINKVLNRKSLARVSGMPGKTATINFYRLDNIRFVDLPGYGYAKVAKNEKSRFSDLINGYFEEERELELVFLLLDMRHLPNEDDKYMAAYLIENEIPFVAILTKCDKLT
ncbi:MAG: ribosome biogenesis GTP-binding protein YihA/YsxC, partial [Oscillospiraceae bacterium]